MRERRERGVESEVGDSKGRGENKGAETDEEQYEGKK